MDKVRYWAARNRILQEVVRAINFLEESRDVPVEGDDRRWILRHCLGDLAVLRQRLIGLEDAAGFAVMVEMIDQKLSSIIQRIWRMRLTEGHEKTVRFGIAKVALMRAAADACEVATLPITQDELAAQIWHTIGETQGAVVSTGL